MIKPRTLWTVFVAVMIGVAVWFVFGQRHAKPPAEIAALELAGGDIAETPSCFSVDAVLKANRLDGSASDAGVVWTTRVHDEWTMRIERGKSWSSYTFRKEGAFLVPAIAVFSDDLPQLGLDEAVDVLIDGARNGAAPQLARCRDKSVSGRS